jgi:outer membrane receptor protein involved in Fe transport
MRRRHKVRPSLTLLALALAAPFTLAHADSPQPQVFTIEAQSLDAALKAFALQTHREIFFTADLTRGKRSHGVSGKHRDLEALKTLLEGTGLTYSITASNAILVRDASAPPASDKGEQGATAGPDTGRAEEKGKTDLAGIEEVVVTAQKRVEKLQDVPSSISVMSGTRLEEVQPNSLVDFASYIPGFNVSSTGSPGQTQITLRGISTGASLGGNLIGTYIDDTPLGSSSGNLRGGLYALDLMPYDIDRIEVLRGPQGTLYGASTMGGLLKYVLRSPDLQQFEGRAGTDLQHIGGSSSPSWGARGSVNLPIIAGQLGIRLSAFHQYTAGYIDNVGLDLQHENHYSQDGGRVAVLWQPFEALKIHASALLQDIDSAGNAAVSIDEFTRRPVFGASVRSTDLAEPYRQRLRYYSLTGDWDLGFATLTSASGWSRTQNVLTQDNTRFFASLIPGLSGGAVPDGLVPFNLRLRLSKFTEEVRLASPGDLRFQWMFGAFFTDEGALNFQQLLADDLAGVPLASAINPLFNALRPSAYRESAVFGNATYRLTDHFDVTGGVRYAENRQTSENIRSGPLSDNLTLSARSSESVVTWMVSPRFKLSPDAMVYARVATGYRPGGPTAGLPGTPPSYASDTLVNYEIGFKGELFDHRLQLDTAVFYIDWKDIQVTATTPQGFNYAANGGTASSKGIELTTSYLLTDGLHVGGTLAFTDARLTQDAPELSGKDGDQLPLSPRWSGSLTADYRRSMGGGRSVSVGAAYRYQGKIYNDVQSAGDAEPAGAQSILDLNAALQMGRATVRLFVKNVTDDKSYSTLFAQYMPPSYAPQFVPVQPRTIGMSLDVYF